MSNRSQIPFIDATKNSALYQIVEYTSAPETVELGEDGVFIRTVAGEEVVVPYNTINRAAHTSSRLTLFLADTCCLTFPLDRATPAVHETISQLMKSSCGIK